MNLRRLLAMPPSNPGQPPLPRRGDAVEAWLRAHRDQQTDEYGQTRAWHLLDGLLDDYRLHADTRTPLDQHVCDGGTCDDCREATR